jgi:hypothetical protein
VYIQISKIDKDIERFGMATTFLAIAECDSSMAGENIQNGLTSVSNVVLFGWFFSSIQ